MKTIGLIGGMSWESTLEYYRLLNEAVKGRAGGYHSARCLLYSVDFAEIEALQRAGDWQAAGEVLAGVARRLEAAGAEMVLLCTNTMHKVAPQIEAALHVPFLHIVDVAARAIQGQGIRRVGLLGTRYTMEGDFYRARLENPHGLTVLIPDGDDRTTIHTIIFEELTLGVIRDESRAAYQAVIGRLAAQGAQGILLGCTEIELLMQQAHSPLPLFPTTRLHVEAAVAWAMAGAG